MNCHTSSRLYVRANGTVPCNCDTGETTTLFRPNLEDLSSFDYVEDCFNGQPFARLRARLLAGKAPIKACESCFFFHPSEPFLKYGDNGRVSELEHVQIESSFQCGVDCDACVQRSIRTNPALSPLDDGPYEMPLELFKKLIDDIDGAGLSVGEMAFCGRGEPLLHPQFAEMMQHARARLPQTFYSVVTSGNAPYSDGLQLVDHVDFSIDGAYPESYEIYRKGGDFHRVLRLAKAIVAGRRPEDEAGPRPRLRWRFILFEHNDSEEEIIHAQKLAREIGFDEMLFVLTHTWNRSRKYTSPEQLDELPEFQVFGGPRQAFSNVNEETDNVSHWEEIGEQPRSERFLERDIADGQ